MPSLQTGREKIRRGRSRRLRRLRSDRDGTGQDGMLFWAHRKLVCRPVCLVETACLFPFEHVHVKMVQYFNEKQQILKVKKCNNRDL